MSRRSDHTREELAELIVGEGHLLLSEVGYARFSAREVAKRIGYSVGTLYNVFGSYDGLMLAVNGRTLDMWRAALVARLEGAPAGASRLEQAIAVYFDFAAHHRHAWAALYDFRLPEDAALPASYAEKLAGVTGILIDEVTAALPPARKAAGPELARSIFALVHGHCFFALNGTFDLLGETDPLAAAIARTREAIAAAGGGAGR
ncbi:TetR/AcrR family transcriptional regulator [Bordetella sp. N]|uniref:TetR/AcrR family transcriptional regulator n=1 Tax=Bordetella sp. N TaxID=1746199 RepID=UPI00070F6046|nr:TetR/AcrR family transcriptional regulator [Bordetella sp. N]ALM86597.1 TetR family transcriptional regulator [Bordetella sp. N]